MRTPLVSIIIPTLNSERTIGALLSSIARQTYPHIEVLVVDGGSTDHTTEIAGEYGANVINNHSLAPDSRTGNKNIGAEAASGDYLYFVDSDMELPPTVIEECVKSCEEGCDALVVTEVSVGNGFWAKCRGLEKQLNHDDPYNVACRFMKAGVFSSAGRFDETMVFQEDIDLHVRVLNNGYTVKIPREIFVYHREEGSLIRMLSKTLYYGKTATTFIRKNPKHSLGRVLIFKPQWLKHYKSFLRHPLIAAGTLFMILAKYVVAFYAMAYSGLRAILRRARHREVVGRT